MNTSRNMKAMGIGGIGIEGWMVYYDFILLPEHCRPGFFLTYRCDMLFMPPYLVVTSGLGVGPNQQFEISTQSYRSDAREWLKSTIYLIKIHV